MKKKYIQEPSMLQGLSLITSCGCNLNCEYCWIAKSKNKNSANLQQKTIEALQNGEFITNCRNVFKKINQSPVGIHHIAFWGQEPTLTLHLITAHLEEWFDLFPSWEGCNFSTNTVGHLDRIIDFIKALEEKAPGEHFELSLQMSYDGEFSTDTLRGAETSKIYANLEEFFTTLNSISLNKVKVGINFHGVLSLELLKKLTTFDDIYNYSNALGEWGLHFVTLNNNKNVRIAQAGVDITFETPIRVGVQEGIDLARFCEMSERINKHTLYKSHQKQGVEFPMAPYESLYLAYFNVLDMMHECARDFNCTSVIDLIAKMQADINLRHLVFNKLNPMMYCGNGVGEIKIMYDGTLVNCQNHIFETDAEFLNPEADEFEDNVKRQLATHHYFINPLKDEDKIIEQYFNLFHAVKHCSIEFSYRSIITLMLLLARIGQIDESYLNYDKVKEHALIATIYNSCSYNNQMMTGSIFLKHTGYLRLVCNGFFDKMLNYYISHRGGCPRC